MLLIMSDNIARNIWLVSSYSAITASDKDTRE